MNVWDFIVLGQIPGTQIQINFTGWLFTMAVLAVGTMTASAVRTALHEETVSGTDNRRQLTTITRLVLYIRIRWTLGNSFRAAANS